jgi:hypothetical protein
MLFYFYTYVPHWYVSFYAVGLAECVSLLIMGVLYVCFRFYSYMFTGGMCAAVWRKVRVMTGIWGYVCPCVIHM